MYVPTSEIEQEVAIETDEITKMLSFYRLVGNSGRKMQLISKIREEYEDKKLFKKLFSQLVKDGYILTNGDKSHISNSGLEYLITNQNNGR